MDLPWIYTGFSWAGGSKRSIRYGAIALGVPIGVIDGTVEGSSGTSDFHVTNALAVASPYPVPWYTPDRAGVPAGQPGGPLLLTFSNGYLGADVYIRGYLERKP